MIQSRLPLINKCVCICLLLLSGLLNNAVAQVIYPAPAGLKPSDEYQVRLNGKAAFVYDSPIPAAYCSFDIKDGVDVVIKVNRDVKWVDVRPLSAGITPVFNDSTIRLRINKPQQLSIEINGSIKHPLFLFANSIENNKPKKNDANVVFFEAGKIHYPGIIELKSNQSVYIEGGAVVVGVVKAKGQKNIKVFGRGILDGTYNRNLNDSLMKAKPADLLNAFKSTKGKYNRFLEFIDCENVFVEGITLHNSTTWQIVPVHCNNVHINNVKVVSDQASDDGTDIVRSKNVIIENSFYRTKDDCIAIKAHLDYPKDEGVDQIMVRNCVFWNALWGNGIEIGFELNSAEVKNVTFKNCDIIHIEAGAAISIHNAGTGHVKNIIFDDIRIEDARQKLFDLAIFRSQYSEDGTRDPEERRKYYLNGAWDGVLMVPSELKEKHAPFRGKISDVVFRNIQIVDGLFPYSVFYGYDARHNINNVTIENLTVHGKRIQSINKLKLYSENTNNVVVR
jgi:hypothetical protein